MIVVIGLPVPRPTPQGVIAGGIAPAIALASAAAGSSVQLVGRVRDDPDGDAMLLALTAGRVGHVATLRQPTGPEAPVLQPPDLDLALRYLHDIAVVVLADGGDVALRAVASEAAARDAVPLIVIVPAGGPALENLAPGATVIGGPAADPDGVFASVVGAFAAALDRGDDPGSAFQTAIGSSAGWSAVPPD